MFEIRLIYRRVRPCCFQSPLVGQALVACRTLIKMLPLITSQCSDSMALEPYILSL